MTFFNVIIIEVLGTRIFILLRPLWENRDPPRLLHKYPVKPHFYLSDPDLLVSPTLELNIENSLPSLASANRGYMFVSSQCSSCYYTTILIGKMDSFLILNRTLIICTSTSNFLSHTGMLITMHNKVEAEC